MDKQHLTATIASLLGALELVLQALGVKSPNIDVQATADALGTLLVLGGTLWAGIRHYVTRKAVQGSQTPPVQSQQ